MVTTIKKFQATSRDGKKYEITDKTCLAERFGATLDVVSLTCPDPDFTVPQDAVDQIFKDEVIYSEGNLMQFSDESIWYDHENADTYHDYAHRSLASFAEFAGGNDEIDQLIERVRSAAARRKLSR